MKHTIGSSLLALMIAGGSSVAIAQSAAPDNTTQPPAAAETQPAPSIDAAAPKAAGKDMSKNSKSDAMRDSAAAPADAATERTYTIAEGEEWIGKRIYSSKGEDIGEVSGLVKGSDGNVEAFHADIGGFLGLGETTVRVSPSQFTLVDDKVTLPMTSEQAKSLPHVEK